MEIIIIVLVVLLIPVIIYAVIQAQKQREARLESLFVMANRLGFSYQAEGIQDFSLQRFLWFDYTSEEDHIVEKLQGFELFKRGHSQKAAPVMQGEIDGHVYSMFDYQYKVTTSTGKSTQTVTYNNSVVIAEVPFWFPNISLTPQSFLHGIAGIFGIHELNTESESFNKRYYIQTDDAKRALEILHPKVIEALEQAPVQSWFWFENYILVFENRLVSDSEYEMMLNQVQWLLSQVPNYYRRDNQ